MCAQNRILVRNTGTTGPQGGFQPCLSPLFSLIEAWRRLPPTCQKESGTRRWLTRPAALCARPALRVYRRQVKAAFSWQREKPEARENRAFAAGCPFGRKYAFFCGAGLTFCQNDTHRLTEGTGGPREESQCACSGICEVSFRTRAHPPSAYHRPDRHRLTPVSQKKTCPTDAIIRNGAGLPAVMTQRPTIPL